MVNEKDPVIISAKNDFMVSLRRIKDAEMRLLPKEDPKSFIRQQEYQSSLENASECLIKLRDIVKMKDVGYE